MGPCLIHGRATTNRPTRLARTALVAADDSGSVFGRVPRERQLVGVRTADRLDALLDRVSDGERDAMINGVTPARKDVCVCGS